MAENNTHTPDRLDTIESRLRRLEERIDRREMREVAVEPWQYLVRRQHPWRKQLYVKGRNMTARQLVGSMNANQLDEQAAADNRVPVEAVREALAYVERNRERWRPKRSPGENVATTSAIRRFARFRDRVLEQMRKVIREEN